ncbi:MAG: alpha/beta fold hydrolase, partial [Lentisphaeraceae bacterium]|nr:alpha/beta fold hydrolase [Lentisphaeraceae bacterium]
MPVRILLFLVCFVFTLSAEKAPFRLSSENTSFIKYLPEGFKHGWIEVPEDYGKPQGRKIHVFYCWRALNNKATPLIYFNGGPGQSMHTSYSMVLEKVTGIPIVFMDQRGTGASTPMPKLSEKNLLRYRHYLSENIARDAEVLRKKLFADKKWAVTGSSFGSLISHKYMCLFPKSLTSVHAHGW